MSLQHPDAAGLHAMWNALRGDRPAPFRAELDAAKIGARAPYLAIYEHVGPSNFRIRIAGDRLNRWFGMELRGMNALSTMAATSRNGVQAALNRVVEEPAVAVVHGGARASDGAEHLFELVMLPMRSDFGRVDRVLAGLWLLDAPGAAAFPITLEARKIAVLSVQEPAAAAPPPAPALAPAPSDAAEPRPALQSIQGDGDAPRRRDRSHLRLVKNS